MPARKFLHAVSISPLAPGGRITSLSFDEIDAADLPGGVGTVTSVGLSMPTGFTVSSSPVMSAGTIAVTITGEITLNSLSKIGGSDGSGNGRISLWSAGAATYFHISGANGYLTCNTGFAATTTSGGDVGQALLGGVSGTTGRGRLSLTDTVAAVAHHLSATTGGIVASGTLAASNLSGTNTGDQTITLTGDATGSGTGSFAVTIGAGAVTASKIGPLNAFTDATPALDDVVPIYDTSATANRDCTIAEIRTLIGVPVGAISPFGASTVPTGWLECDGTAVSRSTYADLFALYGTTYGVGNGSTTFNVPDYRGRTVIGVGTGSGLTARTLAGTGGAETHALSSGEGPSHTHTVNVANNDTNASNNFVAGGINSPTGTATTSSSGSGTAHNNMQPWIAAKWIVKT